MRNLLKEVLRLFIYWSGFFMIVLSIWLLFNGVPNLLDVSKIVFLWSAFVAYVLSVTLYVIYDWNLRRKKFLDKKYEAILKKLKDRGIDFKDE